MAKYSIEDTTLTNIADALRDRNNGWEDVIVGYDELYLPLVKVSKTPNALSLTERDGGYGNNTSLKETVTIPGAVSLEVTVAYQSEGTNYDYLIITEGKTASTSGTKLGGNSLTQRTFTYAGDSVSFYFKSDGSNGEYLGYYAEVRGFDAEGNPILGEEITRIPIYETQACKEYKPTEMADAIQDIKVKVTLTGPIGNVYSADGGICANGRCDIYANDNIEVETKNVTQLFGAFYRDNISNKPIVLNLDGKTTTNVYLTYMCNYAGNIPKVTINANGLKLSGLNSAFQDCFKLKEIEINDAIIDCPASSSNNYSKSAYAFHNCYSLRRINFIDQLQYTANSTLSSNGYHILYYAFKNCYSFDEIVGLPMLLDTQSYTRIPASLLNETFTGCERLKRLTFNVKSAVDGLARGIRAQSMDLSTLGYGENCALYNDDFNESNRVVDDATYQALKDDPDWWTSDVNYSRYNHDSAVETINSLPNISSADYASTIKFKGEAGTLTDGGAINTLTEEEIAVATSKKWTVAFV